MKNATLFTMLASCALFTLFGLTSGQGPVNIAVTAAPFDITAVPVIPANTSRAVACNVAVNSTRFPGTANGTFPLSVNVPAGQRVRVIFANGNLNGQKVTASGEPGVVVLVNGSAIVQQVGGASPIVQNTSSPVLATNAPASSQINLNSPTQLSGPASPAAPTAPAAPGGGTTGTPSTGTPAATTSPGTPAGTPAPPKTSPTTSPTTPPGTPATRPPPPGTPTTSPPTGTPPTSPPPGTPTTSPGSPSPPTPASSRTPPPMPGTPTPPAPASGGTPPAPAPPGISDTCIASMSTATVCLQSSCQEGGECYAQCSQKLECQGHRDQACQNNNYCGKTGCTTELSTCNNIDGSPPSGDTAGHRKLLQSTVPNGPNGGVLGYVALISNTTTAGFVVPNTQFGIPYVEFTAPSTKGQTANFTGALEFATVTGGNPTFPFTPNTQISPGCQVTVNFVSA